mmetsp:Transcript_27580/g.58914  ORF Transcript_27580/g.58914 Transcript_27580/m.58914 type:complete len:506 (+) Transcript_27580:67-1584(+)
MTRMVLRKILILVCLRTTPVAAFLPTSLLTTGRGEEHTWHATGITTTGRSGTSSDDDVTPRCTSNTGRTSSSSESYGEFGPTTLQRSTPTQLRQESFERWLQLPESWASAKNNNAKYKSPSKLSKEAYRKRIQAMDADHPFRIGRTRKQRSAELIHASEAGNATRLELLLQAGADVDAMDLYRITSLHYAACHGHMEAVQLLLKWGANNPTMLEESSSTVAAGGGSSSPLRAAFANGHTEIFAVLNRHSCGNTRLPTAFVEPPTTTQFNDIDVRQPLKTTVISLDSDHVGAGSFYIDNAVRDDCIETLVTLHESLRENNGPQHDRHHQHRAMQSTNAARRSHYCDTEGWLCAALNTALQQRQSPTQQQSTPQHVFSHFRFVSYIGENATTSFLAPHKDLPVLDRSSGHTSTHTFILYLTTVAQGGETVLLDHLPANNNNVVWKDTASSNQNSNNDTLLLDDGMIMSMRYAVQPVLGRMFVFPHGCPHAGRHVVDGSKLISRGDAW